MHTLSSFSFFIKPFILATNKIIVANIIKHFMFYLNISWHKIGTLLRLKGNFTHVTIDIAYSIPIFYQHFNRCFFCIRKPFADSSQYLHSTYSVLPLK